MGSPQAPDRPRAMSGLVGTDDRRSLEGRGPPMVAPTRLEGVRLPGAFTERLGLEEAQGWDLLRNARKGWFVPTDDRVLGTVYQVNYPWLKPRACG